MQSYSILHSQNQSLNQHLDHIRRAEAIENGRGYYIVNEIWPESDATRRWHRRTPTARETQPRQRPERPHARRNPTLHAHGRRFQLDSDARRAPPRTTDYAPPPRTTPSIRRWPRHCPERPRVAPIRGGRRPPRTLRMIVDRLSDSDARRSSTKAKHGNLVIGRDAELRYIVSSGRARAAIRRRHRARRLTRRHRA